MCLYTKHEKPLVAKRDIKVYKHVRRVDLQRKVAESPCQGTKFALDTDFIPDKPAADIYRRSDDLYEINGGVIHACLWPDFSRGYCLEAYIPAGTEYWIGCDHTTLCARKLVVKSKPVSSDEFYGLDEVLSEMLYDSAEEKNGIKVGDFFYKDGNNESFVAPAQVPNLPKDKIKGMVVGFDGDEPLIADVTHIFHDVQIDDRYNSKLDEFFNDRSKAKKDMNGYKHTKAWKSKCQGESRFGAYAIIEKLGEDYYIPALGEMETLLENILYVAAACSLAGVSLPITMGKSFWTSTEFSQCHSWRCGIRDFGVGGGWDYKYCHLRVAPFIASAKKK